MLSEQLGVTLDPALLELAFTHRSYAYESGSKETNERLEFLGDSVLGLIVTEELYKRYPDFDESRLSPFRSGARSQTVLAVYNLANTSVLEKAKR
jgi:ribonuclease-3